MRAQRNSRGEWCRPVDMATRMYEPVGRRRVLEPLGIPAGATQREADEAAWRRDREEAAFRARARGTPLL